MLSSEQVWLSGLHMCTKYHLHIHTKDLKIVKGTLFTRNTDGNRACKNKKVETKTKLKNLLDQIEEFLYEINYANI